MNFIIKWIEKQVRRVLEKIDIEREWAIWIEEEKKKMSLVDLKDYYDLTKKITSKEFETLKMTKENFDRYNNLTKPYLSFANDFFHYRGIPIEVIKEKKKKNER